MRVVLWLFVGLGGAFMLGLGICLRLGRESSYALGFLSIDMIVAGGAMCLATVLMGFKRYKARVNLAKPDKNIRIR